MFFLSPLSFYVLYSLYFFFFNDTATTEIYTLSLHDALPIWTWRCGSAMPAPGSRTSCRSDRKSTRLNSSHVKISYAVFCLKKKKKIAHLASLQKKKKNNANLTERNIKI